MTNDQPALSGYCPVAYFVADGPLLGSAEFASTHKGEAYYLVSADAKAMFDENPDKYAPEYGGACAYGMSIGETFPVDPTSYKIVNDRLFLFLKNEATDALVLWNKEDEAATVAKADANFSK
jgi:YHS domain-containing protein